MKNIHMAQGLSKFYKYDYKESYNEKENCIEIKATMKIDLNSKAAKNKLYRSWKKDKSPLLTQLQELDRDHKKELKEEKTSLKIYDIDEFEKIYCENK